MAKIVTENDIGKGLAIEGNKMVAKVSAAAGNAIQATEEGLFVPTPTAPLAELRAKDALNDTLRGEKVESLAGATLGYLMKAD